ncbi:hypothetical protein E3P99_03967 [Wallemia hederae]|uniref:Protein OS-9 homolog n=1 Tax=Wallemia hederae TaxID=1540922 RepID=A0A4T0FBV0_9BASI|nr:hypothetical protein E3P99_03967 [Wallemia hederae]
MPLTYLVACIALFSSQAALLTSASSFISQTPSYSVQFARRTFVTPEEAKQILRAGEVSLETYAVDATQPLTVADIALREPLIPLNPFEESTPHRFQLYPNYSFICLVPAKDDAHPTTTHNISSPTINDVARILDSVRGECSLFTSGKWWTYRVCFNGAIKQFHAKRTPVFSDNRQQFSLKVEYDDTVPSYVLGRSPVQSPNSTDTTSDVSNISKVDQAPASLTLRILSNGYQNFAAESWSSGTTCDRTGEPRSANVEYYCVPGLKSPRVVSIHETTTCNYVVQVEVGHLCEIPSFNHINLRQKVKEIQCIPILEHGSKWPDLLLEDEETSLVDGVHLPSSESLDTLSKEDLIELIARSQMV